VLAASATATANSFGFTATEAVAILGAHTLGRANPANSGFQGPWVRRDNTLDNAYYADLNNSAAGWAQATVQVKSEAPIPVLGSSRIMSHDSSNLTPLSSATVLAYLESTSYDEQHCIGHTMASMIL
jgi:hypothetical protein